MRQSIILEMERREISDISRPRSFVSLFLHTDDKVKSMLILSGAVARLKHEASTQLFAVLFHFFFFLRVPWLV